MKQLTLQKKILLLSILLHAFLLFLSICISSAILPSKKTKQTIVVRTVIEKPQPKKIQSQTAAKTPVAQSKKVTKTPPKVKPKKQKTTKTKRKKTIVKQSTSANKQQKARAILKQLDKNLKELDTLSFNSKETRLPKKLVLSSINDSLTKEQQVNCMEIISCIQNNLTLPENGEVKLTISVQPNGKIDNIQIIHAESMKNANYLKNQLKELTLPKVSEKPVTMTVTFRGENI